MTEELNSFLELCFGDADDDEGLEDLKTQLSIYEDRAKQFQAELVSLLTRDDGRECQEILKEYTHQCLSTDQAVEWFRWLARALNPAPE